MSIHISENNGNDEDVGNPFREPLRPSKKPPPVPTLPNDKKLDGPPKRMTEPPKKIPPPPHANKGAKKKLPPPKKPLRKAASSHGSHNKVTHEHKSEKVHSDKVSRKSKKHKYKTLKMKPGDGFLSKLVSRTKAHSSAEDSATDNLKPPQTHDRTSSLPPKPSFDTELFVRESKEESKTNENLRSKEISISRGASPPIASKNGQNSTEGGSPTPSVPPTVDSDPNEALIEAVKANDVSKCIECLDAGADLEYTGKEGHKPGFYAEGKEVALFVKTMKALNEIITSERTFVDKLKFTVDHILLPLKQSKILDDDKVHKIFMNLQQILMFNSQLLDKFEKEVVQSNVAKRVEAMTTIFVEPGLINFMKVYNDYSSQYMESTQLLGKLTKKNAKFSKFLVEKKNESKFKLGLSSLLAEPFQRLPRYEMLLKELLKRLEENTPIHTKLTNALTEIKNLNTSINVKQTEKENFSVWQEKFKDKLNLLEASRRFVHHGTVNEYNPENKEVISKGLHFIMFNDCLLITQNEDNEILDLIGLLFLEIKEVPAEQSSFLGADNSFQMINYMTGGAPKYYSSESTATWMEKINQEKEELRQRQHRIAVEEVEFKGAGKKTGAQSPGERYFTSVTVPGGTKSMKDKRVYVIGGLPHPPVQELKDANWSFFTLLKDLHKGKPKALDTCGVWDLTQQKWRKPCNNLKKPLYAHSTVSIGPKQILCYGGTNDDNSLYSLNVKNGKWSQVNCKGTASPSRYLHTMSRVKDNIVILGGIDKTGKPVPFFQHIFLLNLGNKIGDSLWIKINNPEKHKWKDEEVLFGHTATVVSEKIYVFGGCRSFEPSGLTDRTLVVNTARWNVDELLTIGKPPTPRALHSAAELHYKFIVHGGINEKGELLNDTSILYLDSSTWVSCSNSKSIPKCLHSSYAPQTNTKITFFGGLSNKKDPVAGEFSVFELDTSRLRKFPQDIEKLMNEAKRKKRVLAASDSNTSKIDLAKWSNEDVLAWLDTIGLSAYTKNFKKGGVDGTRLLSITDDYLKDNLKIKNQKHREKVIFLVEQFRNELLLKLRDGRFAGDVPK